MNATILVIDDDQDLAEMLHVALSRAGHRIVCAGQGYEGMEKLQAHDPDLVLLDLLVPDIDGWEICRRIRESSDIPIIMMTALGREQDVIRGLELGADDYVTKPFRLGELKARIRAALRRGRDRSEQAARLQVDDRLVIDQATHSLMVDGQPVDLSVTEYKLFTYFLENKGRILTRQSLLSYVWGWEYMDQSDYLKVYVHRLRKKIEQNSQEPRYIVTERGLGYRFQIPAA